MKYFFLVWAGLTRKPVRTTLTIVSIAVAFLIFGALRSVTSSIDSVLESMSPTRLRVQNKAGLLAALPLGYLSQIEHVPGVRSVSFASIFPAYFVDPSNEIGAVAVDARTVAASLPPGYSISAETIAALEHLRTGAVVNRKLAQRYGWKLGDKIPLYSEMWPQRDGNAVWTFDVVGYYDAVGQPAVAQELWFNYSYLDEGRAFGNGKVHLYTVIADDASHVAAISAAIDALFLNSSNATLTQSDREWLSYRLKRVGDIRFVVNAIVAAALFALLFVIAATVMQSARERRSEFAVLKAIGYSDTSCLLLIFAEAVLMSEAGVLVGLAAAFAIVPFITEQLQLGPMPFVVILDGIGVSVLLAALSALVPAWRARQLQVVDEIGRS